MESLITTTVINQYHTIKRETWRKNIKFVQISVSIT